MQMRERCPTMRALIARMAVTAETAASPRCAPHSRP